MDVGSWLLSEQYTTDVNSRYRKTDRGVSLGMGACVQILSVSFINFINFKKLTSLCHTDASMSGE